MYLLDTNLVSELRKARTGKADPGVVAWAKGVSADDLYISVITMLELELGVQLRERRDPAQGMSFPRYPAYKDSGVEWLGEVPEHWDLPKLKHVARFSAAELASRDNLESRAGTFLGITKDMKVELVDDAEETSPATVFEKSTTNLIPPGRVLLVVRSGILKHTITGCDEHRSTRFAIRI